MAFGGLPYVYDFREKELLIADTASGNVQRYTADYHNEPVGADEFSSKTELLPDWLPDISHFKERRLLAVTFDDSGNERSGLYRMDGETWLVDFRGIGIWTIYRIRKTDETTPGDIDRLLEFRDNNPQSAEQPNGYYADSMTLKDVYTLARKGEALSLQDLETFHYQLVGPEFKVRLYDIVGAYTLFITLNEKGSIRTADLLSPKVYNNTDTVDLRYGFSAVTAYLSPLRAIAGITIEDPHEGSKAAEDVRDSDGREREMFFEDDYFGSRCRYYLNSKRADKVFVVFENRERLPIKQALQERLITVEKLVAAGLSNVSMVPIDNPLGGEFVILHHLYTFELNGEGFYPSKSFMYVAFGDNFTVYYDFDELIETLSLYGYDAFAELLLQAVEPSDIISIAGSNYVHDEVLTAAGAESTVGWAFSSHTPVWFTLSDVTP